MNLGLRGHSKTPEDIAMGLTKHCKALRDSFKMQLEEFQYKDITFNSPTRPSKASQVPGSSRLSAASVGKGLPTHYTLQLFVDCTQILKVLWVKPH